MLCGWRCAAKAASLVTVIARNPRWELRHLRVRRPSELADPQRLLSDKRLSSRTPLSTAEIVPKCRATRPSAGQSFPAPDLQTLHGTERKFASFRAGNRA